MQRCRVLQDLWLGLWGDIVVTLCVCVCVCVCAVMVVFVHLFASVPKITQQVSCQTPALWSDEHMGLVIRALKDPPGILPIRSRSKVIVVVADPADSPPGPWAVFPLWSFTHILK